MKDQAPGSPPQSLVASSAAPPPENTTTRKKKAVSDDQVEQERKKSNSRTMSTEWMDGDCDLTHEVHRLRDLVRRQEQVIVLLSLTPIPDPSFGPPVCRMQEIVELRSHLDKYQAVFSFTGTSRPLASPLSPRTGLAASKKRTRTRLFGISAEPAPSDSTSGSSTVRDLPPIKTYPKDDA